MARLSASVFAPALRQVLPALLALAAVPSAAQLPERPAAAPDAGHCLPAPPGSLTPQQARLTALLDRIEATFPGPDPLIAAAAPAAICLDDRPMEGLGFYEPGSQSLVLDAGLSERNAECMAGRMVDRLSIAQLRKLERLSGEKRSLTDYVVAVRRVGDAEALAVTASSAALCASGLAR